MLLLYYTGMICIVPSLVLLVPYLTTFYQDHDFDIAIFAEWLIVLLYGSATPAIITSIIGVYHINPRMIKISLILYVLTIFFTIITTLFSIHHASAMA
jgi:maltodextrin utilization protein YvdJ